MIELLDNINTRSLPHIEYYHAVFLTLGAMDVWFFPKYGGLMTVLLLRSVVKRFEKSFAPVSRMACGARTVGRGGIPGHRGRVLEVLFNSKYFFMDVHV